MSDRVYWDKMEDDEACLKIVRKRLKKTSADIKVELVLLRDGEDVQCAIKSHLHQLELSNSGRFNKYRKCSEKREMYHCERKNKPKRKDSGPTTTRANDCNAYVTFRVEECIGRHVLVINSQLQHRNHDPSCTGERMRSQLHPQLMALIEDFNADNKKPAEILVECVKWTKENGHTDIYDRRYHPTLSDVQNLVKNARKRLRLGPGPELDDATSVAILCLDLLKDSISLFQPFDSAIEQEMIIVYQSEEQRKRSKHADIVFMDATYKGMASYRYAFYVLIGRNSNGNGTPLAYIILTKDDTSHLEKALTALKNSMTQNNICFQPRAFMIDRDIHAINAIEAVFPHSTILLCWFHVMRAVYRWLNTAGSTVSGKEGVPKRKEIVHMMRTLKFCDTVEDFDKKISELVNQVPSAVFHYLEKEWFPNGRMWANFGRPFCLDNRDTNNLAERFFLCLKYQHLGEYGNQRIADLLLKLDGDVLLYYKYIEKLTLTGRQRPGKTFGHGSNDADIVNLRIWVEQTLSCGQGVYLVPSAVSDATEWHKVDVASCTCDCIVASQEEMCKHVRVALQTFQLSENNIEELRHSVAKDIFDTDGFDYTAKQVYFLVYDGNYINFVSTATKQCSCIAASHQQKCICVLVLDMVESHAVLPTTAAVSPTTADVSPATVDVFPTTIYILPTTVDISPTAVDVSTTTVDVSTTTTAAVSSPSSSSIESDSNFSLTMALSSLTAADCNLPQDTEIENPLRQLKEKCDKLGKRFTNITAYLDTVAECPKSLAVTIRQAYNLVFKSYRHPVRCYARRQIQTKRKWEGNHSYASDNVDGSAKRLHHSKTP